MKWKDTTSFSQGDELRIPRTFVAMAGSLKITVTRHIDHDPTEWVLICDPFFRKVVIGNRTADEAKAAAIVAVRVKLKTALDALTPNAELRGASRDSGEASP